VKTGGPHSEDGSKPTDAENNVVRFPRDWIGPRKDLVPFGPAADPPTQTASTFTAPPSADDFWGEDSAAVQDALQAPHAGVLDGGASEVHPVEQVDGPHRGDRAARPHRAPRFPRRVSRSAPRAPVAQTASAWRRRVRLALGLFTVAAGVGLLLGHLLIDKSGRRVPTVATARSPGNPLEFGSLRRWIGGAVPHASREIAARIRVPPRRSVRREPARRSHKTHKASHGAGAPTTSFVASSRGSTTGSASTATSNGGTTASAASAPATSGSAGETVRSSSVTNDSGGSSGGGSSGGGSSGGGSSGGGSSGGGSSGGGSSGGGSSGGGSSGGGSSGGGGQPSGPVGPGAPFGPGKLG
jgi:hypothetical protein